MKINAAVNVKNESMKNYLTWLIKEFHLPLNQTEISKILGVSKAAVSKYCLGKTRIKIKNIELIEKIILERLKSKIIELENEIRDRNL